MMDYSLLIGIHDIEKCSHSHDSFASSDSLSQCMSNNARGEGQSIYFFGVIDILTQFDIQKKAENIFKRFLYAHQDISSINPKKYGARFLTYINKHVK